MAHEGWVTRRHPERRASFEAAGTEGNAVILFKKPPSTGQRIAIVVPIICALIGALVVWLKPSGDSGAAIHAGAVNTVIGRDQINVTAAPMPAKEAEPGLYLECHPTNAITTSHDGLANVFEITESGHSTLSETRTAPNIDITDRDVRNRFLLCTVANYGSSVRVNVRIPIRITFRPPVPAPQGGINSGPISTTQDSQLNIRKIDPGKETAFIFSVRNLLGGTFDFLEFPNRALTNRLGSSIDESVPLTSPDNWSTYIYSPGAPAKSP